MRPPLAEPGCASHPVAVRLNPQHVDQPWLGWDYRAPAASLSGRETQQSGHVVGGREARVLPRARRRPQRSSDVVNTRGPAGCGPPRRRAPPLARV